MSQELLVSKALAVERPGELHAGQTKPFGPAFQRRSWRRSRRRETSLNAVRDIGRSRALPAAQHEKNCMRVRGTREMRELSDGPTGLLPLCRNDVAFMPSATVPLRFEIILFDTVNPEIQHR